jgi:hypothetical protein
MPTIDDVPELDDPSHNATRGELVRLFLANKDRLGIGCFADDAIIAHIDDVAAVILARFLSDRERFAAKFPALAEAFGRLQNGQRIGPMDG